MDPIGRKPADVARMLDRLGRALAAPEAAAATPVTRPVSASAGTDLRGELVAAFRDVDTSDEQARKRARATAIPAIVRHTFDGLGYTEAELASAIHALESLFDTDPRLSALLARAIEAARA